MGEIIGIIKDFGKFDENNVEEVSVSSLINDINAILELPNQKNDHIRIAKLENTKKMLENYEEAYDEYDSLENDSLDDQVNKNMYADELIEIQKEINKELDELIKELKVINAAEFLI